jgi:hypothetical protein
MDEICRVSCIELVLKYEQQILPEKGAIHSILSSFVLVKINLFGFHVSDKLLLGLTSTVSLGVSCEVRIEFLYIIYKNSIFNST